MRGQLVLGKSVLSGVGEKAPQGLNARLSACTDIEPFAVLLNLVGPEVDQSPGGAEPFSKPEKLLLRQKLVVLVLQRAHVAGYRIV